MNSVTIARLKQTFDSIAQIFPDSDIEFWYARDLQRILGYSEWRNFLKVIKKAKEAAINSGVPPTNHFVDVNKKVDLGSGAKREIDDIMLTRYACYLIGQNGDPRKEKIAFAQTYFAVQTRKSRGRLRVNVGSLFSRFTLTECKTLRLLAFILIARITLRALRHRHSTENQGTTNDHQ